MQDYVPLRRRGANLIGLCPFHSERTGSFTVSPAKGIFKCFGCGESGNAVGFVMKIDNCSFAEAARTIAKKYHIEIEEREMTSEERQRQDDREAMFAVNEWANKWFQEQLWNTPEGQAIGLSYFRERGLQDTTIRKFGLGYAPDKNSAMTDAALAAGYTDRFLTNDPDTLIGTGVSGKREDGKVYDRFRDRVIFPIYTTSGKTVAFAGRILRKKYDREGKEIPQGKYVNSPGSTIYSKTNELYGLFQAKAAITRKNLCYLVEGQMDALSMHQAGLENVVCSGGTALTQPQVRLIKRFTTNITVLYDGDSAGIHAAIRGIDMFLKEGFTVKVVLLPDGEDPDSYARSHDATEFIRYIDKHQTDFIRFKAQLSWEQVKNDPSKRSELTHDLVESISLIPDEITRYEYIRDCATVLQSSAELLTRSVNQRRFERREEAQRQYKQQSEQQAMDNLLPTAPQQNDTTGTQTTAASQTHTLNKRQQLLRNITQLIVRYGERPFVDSEGAEEKVGTFLIKQIEGDEIPVDLPIDKQIYDEYTRHHTDPDFVAEKFFTRHPDPEVSELACNLIADQYQLSTIFSRVIVSEHVTREAEQQTEQDMLQEVVPQLLCELKLCQVEDQLALLTRELRHATDEQALSMLAMQRQLIDIKRQLLQYLGRG